MEVNEPRVERSVTHDDTTFWVGAEPEGDDNFWDRDYWTAYKDGTPKEEGVEVPWWYRRLTSWVYGYRWEK